VKRIGWWWALELRWRWRRVRWWVAGLVLLGAVGLSSMWWWPLVRELVTSYLGLTWEERDHRASVVGVVVGVLSLLSSLLLSVLALVPTWRGSRTVDSGGTSPAVGRAALLVGRQWPRMAELSPRRARVHPALELPPSTAVDNTGRR
jgi:hypothetical protein